MKNSYTKIFIFIALGAVITSCKKSSENVSLERSAWVESGDRTDTLVFSGKGSLILNRPRELRNGYLLPRIGAGPYSFRELKDSISLLYSLSSLYRFNNYTFKIEQNRLYIGDFYQKNGRPNQLLTFDRLR